MPIHTYTQINSRCQPFTEISHSIDSKTLKSVFTYASKRQTSDIRCPFCAKMNVYIHENIPLKLRIFRIIPNTVKVLFFIFIDINKENVDEISQNLYLKRFHMPE